MAHALESYLSQSDLKPLLNNLEDWVETELDKPHRFPTFYPSDQTERWKSILNQVILQLADYDGKLSDLRGCRRGCRKYRVDGEPRKKLITCLDWQMCPLCAPKKGWEMISKYLPFFDYGDWHHLTIRFQPMSPYWGDPYAYWLAVQRALPLWHKQGGIEGIMAWEELTVVGLYPEELVNPHVHAVVLTVPGQEPDVDALTDLITRYRGEERAEKLVKVGIKDPVTGEKRMEKRWRTSPRWKPASFRRLASPLPHAPVILPVHMKDEQHFVNVLGYMKPLNMLDAYLRDFPTDERHGDLEFLHQNCRSVLDFWFTCHCDARNNIQYLGKLRGGKGAYCVDAKTRKCKWHWKRINARLKALNVATRDHDEFWGE
jgi:hypothetical protein